jgi:tetratricopeptide (TPR) repeat protein
MIPTEADLQAQEQIEFDCVAADRVLAYMESAATKVNIIIMDACRNNPFERSWHRSVEGNGLAMMNAPTGSLIAYATAPGRVASDGETANGLYTSALLKYMRDPGLNIEQIFKRVRTEVSERSMGAQIPWETTSLTGNDFYFLQGEKPQTTSQVPSPSSGAVDHYSRGSEKYDAKDYNGAILEYTKAIEANPLYVEAYLWRAHGRYALTLYSEALADYSKVLELSPGEAQAYYYRGLSKYNLGQNAEAVPDFSLTIKYDPSYINAYYWRGNSYLAQQKYFAALEDFNKTVELSPQYGEGYYVRGLTHYNTTDYSKALADFTKALSITPDYPEAMNMKANSNYMLKDYEKAVTDYTVYLVKKENADAYYWRAYSYFSLNQPDRALADVNKALQLSPGNTTYLTFKKDVLKK